MPQKPRRRSRWNVPTARIKEREFVPACTQQARIWFSNAKILAAISGHGGGKSHLGAYWLLDQCWKFPGHDFIVCGPTFNTLGNSSIPKLRALLSLYGLPWEYDQHTQIGFRSAHNEYWLPGGGIIYFRSADRPGSMQGTHAKAFWMDEVVDTTFYVYETLRGRIRLQSGRGLITSTPYDRGWLYEQIYKKWQELGGLHADPNGPFFCSQWKSVDNPNYPKDEYEDAKRTMEDWRFRMLYEGEFERPMGLIYDCFKEEHWIEPFPIPDNWPRVLGIDFGFRDPFACIWLAQEPGGRWFAYDEFYEVGWMRYASREQNLQAKHSQPQDMVDEVIDRCDARSDNLIAVYCDSADAEMCDFTQERFFQRINFRDVYGATKGPGSIKSGIQTNYRLVRSNQFYAFNTLTHFKDEVETYSYEVDKVTGEPLPGAVPQDKNNHLLDAWRYAIAGSPDEEHSSFGFGSLDAGWAQRRSGVIIPSR